MTRPIAFLLLLAPAAAAQDRPPPPPPPPLALTLGEAVRLAAAEAPAVELAALRTDAARARVRQARAGLLPTLGVGAEWRTRTFNRASLGFDFPVAPGTPPPPDLVGPFDNVDARLRFVQPLFDWSSVMRVRAAGAQVAGSAADGAATSEAAAETAAILYLRAAHAGALLAARRADSALAAELVALAAAQEEAGVGTPIDVTRARTQLAVAREAIVLAAHERERARVELARALGLPAGAAVAVTEPLTDTMARAEVPSALEGAVALALARRPDLAAEVARGRAAEQSAAAITAERLPRVELAADYGVNGPTAADAIATRQIAVQVAVPILDGFRREGRLAEQRAIAAEARRRREALERDVAAQVEVALLEGASARAQGAVAGERLRLAEEELDQARERFAAGVAGNIEVINAQVALLDARDAVIDARFAAAVARVAVARATGTARELR